MAKPIYFSLLLLVLCLIYESYGNHHTVRHIRLPSHRISSDNGPYVSSSSSSSSSTTGADATATSESAETSLSPSSSLRKSLSLNNSLGYGKNRGLGLNSKSLSGKYYEQQPNDMDSDDLNNRQIQNSMNSHFLNNKPQNGVFYKNNGIDRQNSMTSEVLNSKPLKDLYSMNNQNDKTLEGPSIGKRQNSITSGALNFPNSSKTKIIPLASLMARQKTLSPSSNEDDSQQISVGNDNSSMMMNSIKIPLNEQHIVFKQLRKCCINRECRILQDGEECSINDYFKNMKTKQQPNNPTFTTSSNGENGLNDMMSKFKLFGKNSFNNLGDDMDDLQETGKPTNMRLGSMRYSAIIPSIGSSNGMGSYVMPQKRKPINYPHSDPIDLSEDEANEIRDQVLQKSNFYREKYGLEPFTLDDQLNNCAQDWANQMVKLKIFDHREDNVYGENLFSSLDFNNLGEQAVDSWYNEITKFNIADEEPELGDNIATHHMTQLLWKSSTKLGVGVSKSSNGMYNVVANYDPSGNVRGFFKDNLPEIKQEDIEEAMDSHNSQTISEPKSISWSSSSIPPLESEWQYEPYYN
ncbi:uncharacterized protein LOC100162791 isoform X1 [Acyrthosiphon pisum]|uniref:SCP domain-containing protein n=1 Tax=Acyrthosiphon pisum TaxID=7029 RepID=A0A8R2A4I2_ACYPI|nr:uncharacterized protein LOC100162791 isoform X1 [Acyrthosiphon pisum]|eukprot:XP_001948456.2 PREDICTED: uncharacterized protein LOC100162791 [Acyrthosiphon pisum]